MWTHSPANRESWSASPGTAAELADANLIVLPGTRATVADLAWLRGRGIDHAVARHTARGLPVLGICGGYQMLGSHIDDEVESGAGQVPGLGLLPVRTSVRPGQGTRPGRHEPSPTGAACMATRSTTAC